MNHEQGMNKLRLLKIWDILRQETDEAHPMGTEVLRERLHQCGIECHRSTLYEDIHLLNAYGYEILTHRGRGNEYYVIDRPFSDPEIHILMDAIQAINFLTEKKTAELTDKLAQMVGSKRGEAIKANIVPFNTTKNVKEDIYYNVNEIVTAIKNKRKVSFLYFDYDCNHNQVYRKNRNKYTVSPLATIFDNGYYYLIDYSTKYNTLVNYRIDRMENVKIEDEPTDELPAEVGFDPASYKKSLFSMYSGTWHSVTLQAKANLINTIFDRFGEKTRIVSYGEDSIRFTVDVQISPLFWGWCCSFGDNLKLVSPENLVEEFQNYLKTIQSSYPSAPTPSP